MLAVRGHPYAENDPPAGPKDGHQFFMIIGYPTGITATKFGHARSLFAEEKYGSDLRKREM